MLDRLAVERGNHVARLQSRCFCRGFRRNGDDLHIAVRILHRRQSDRTFRILLRIQPDFIFFRGKIHGIFIFKTRKIPHAQAVLQKSLVIFPVIFLTDHTVDLGQLRVHDLPFVDIGEAFVELFHRIV